MCGIAGFIDAALQGRPQALDTRARAMADAIAHRGPDGDGIWSDPDTGIALAHRRLAIVDLTATGAQPMTSSDGRWVISYNGEIYNASSIKSAPELKNHTFRGTSDTEAILESLATYGLDRTMADINGMFAIALWDRQMHELHLVRDRVGIKPLFYGRAGGATVFASELKGFFALDGIRWRVNRASVVSFLRFGYVPAPWSILADVAKVMPGEIVTIRTDGTQARRRYWSMAEVAAEGLADPVDLSDTDAESKLHDLLADAVAGQMMSDVPLGAFLSGGVDFSLIASLMKVAASGPVRTFSIGFDDRDFDESEYATAVANHIGTDHTALHVSGEDALAIVPQLAEMYDEPFADSSQIPTYLLSKLTREHVTVALSGDGGDELFGGYNRYLVAQALWAKFSRVPLAMRRAAAATIAAMPLGALEVAGRVVPPAWRVPQFADKLKKFGEILPRRVDDIYLRLVSQYDRPEALADGAAEHPQSLLPPDDGTMENMRRMQLADGRTYLPDDILQKVDRASMAVALEVRPPILDHRIVALSWRLPLRFHIRGGETKWLLRRVLDRYVPRHLIERPKMGFGVPLAAWLRGPLRTWADDLLDPRNAEDDGLNAAAVNDLWIEHCSGRRNWAYAIWNILMYRAWARRWHDKLA